MKILAHAKLNLFLNIINKRDDGYHNIRTGVTFVDLHDEVTINKSLLNSISYTGVFAPTNHYYDNDILIKTLNYINKKNKKNFFVEIIVKKNIPFGSGLGGASANAAAVIKGLIKLKLIDFSFNSKELSLLGADIPMCIKSEDCIAEGIGEKLKLYKNFPKVFFVLVKPKLSLSTKKIYSSFVRKNIFRSSQQNDQKNDLESIAINLYPEIQDILIRLSKFRKILFFRMTGSGSCCYGAFHNMEEAEIAMQQLNKEYPDYWVYTTKNKTIN